MKSCLLISFFCLCILSFSSCIVQDGRGAVFLGQKDECGFAVNQYTGERLQWSQSHFPIPFYVHVSVPLEAHRNFISAIDHWNIAWEDFLIDQGLEPFALFSVVNETHQYSGTPSEDDHNMLFFVRDGFSNYESNTVQAFTKMNYDRSSQIEDTDIIVNGENFDYFYDRNYDDEVLAYRAENAAQRGLAGSSAGSFWFRLKQKLQNWFHFLLKPFQKAKPDRQIAAPRVTVPKGKVDFPSLMIHELGHVPGMAHFENYNSRKSSRRASERKPRNGGRSYSNPDFTSVMEPLLASGRSRRAIKRYDLNNLFCGYFEY